MNLNLISAANHLPKEGACAEDVRIIASAPRGMVLRANNLRSGARCVRPFLFLCRQKAPPPDPPMAGQAMPDRLASTGSFCMTHVLVFVPN